MSSSQFTDPEEPAMQPRLSDWPSRGSDCNRAGRLAGAMGTAEHVGESGEKLFQAADQLGLEGISVDVLA